MQQLLLSYKPVIIVHVNNRIKTTTQSWEKLCHACQVQLVAMKYSASIKIFVVSDCTRKIIINSSSLKIFYLEELLFS